MKLFWISLTSLLVAVICQTDGNLCSADVLVMTKEEMRKEIKTCVDDAFSRNSISVAKTETDGEMVSKKIEELVLSVERNISELISRKIDPLLARLNALHKPGVSRGYPAASCKEIYDYDSSTPSGKYWIGSFDGKVQERYCDMSRTCGGVKGGWMSVASLDMRNNSHQCPVGLTQRTHPGKRLCGMNINGGGCSHVGLSTGGYSYSKVCGKIIAYQFGSPDSFGLAPFRQRTIDQGYLDGVSLTHGHSPRKHIWSFAAALDEVTSTVSNCLCTNVNLAHSATHAPNFVGTDYFCDTASKERFISNHLYPADPLWDGAGCGPANTCCTLNNPPWFYKQLLSSTTDDIEMRVCCNQDRNDEDVRIEQIEIYVQ